MSTGLHRDLDNAELHEPKDVSEAAADKVYVSDGAGSGDWTDPPASTPLAHDLAGTEHNADTLANLNSKISGDDLVGTSQKGAANGVAELDADSYVPDAQLRCGPFGEGFESAVDETASSTTSGTFQQKLRLSFTVPEAGNYVVMWHYDIYHDNNTLTEAAVAQAELDDTTQLGRNLWSYTPEQHYSGMWYGSLTAAAHTVDIDYRVLGGVGTATIENARIVAFRVD